MNNEQTLKNIKKTIHYHGFKSGESIVYPAHGVGKIISIETQEVAGYNIELFIIHFKKDKMNLKVPVSKVLSIGIRKLSAIDFINQTLKILQGRARIKRVMWSRRAQEYDSKIHSGNLIAIAEVVRDLYRSNNKPEQSYSERQLYESAIDRMAREIAIVKNVSEIEAIHMIKKNLIKNEDKNKKKENLDNTFAAA